MKIYFVGISWPPETFILHKLCMLANSGIEVVVAATRIHDDLTGGLPGLRVMHLPRPDGSWRARAELLWLWIRGTLLSPREIWRTWKCSCADSSRFKSQIISFLKILPFLGGNPDVVHFEWNAGAIVYRSLLRYLLCPIIVSCRGAQVQIAPQPGAKTDHQRTRFRF